MSSLNTEFYTKSKEKNKMRYTLDDIKQLQENAIYAFKVDGHRRRIFGVPQGITVVTGYSLWAGCDAIKVRSWYRWHGEWYPSNYSKIIPICEILDIEKIKKLE